MLELANEEMRFRASVVATRSTMSFLPARELIFSALGQ
jgi:hypothetical protein